MKLSNLEKTNVTTIWLAKCLFKRLLTGCFIKLFNELLAKILEFDGFVNVLINCRSKMYVEIVTFLEQ